VNSTEKKGVFHFPPCTIVVDSQLS
jgi:hypothetical protein